MERTESYRHIARAAGWHDLASVIERCASRWIDPHAIGGVHYREVKEIRYRSSRYRCSDADEQPTLLRYRRSSAHRRDAAVAQHDCPAGVGQCGVHSVRQPERNLFAAHGKRKTEQNTN